ncbi:hypothetical protein SKAU_G00401650 [Synaphobranchus kaupii]|uniref:Uncharacterized protein n=1 Tax=Synaphobranchus kaupii TaxID=118154 RepID=A0A9Q1E958_SYNKA|nr:hypothetical protein SKAU_G00401650 [Synaphobranchus kaupii]
MQCSVAGLADSGFHLEILSGAWLAFDPDFKSAAATTPPLEEHLPVEAAVSSGHVTSDRGGRFVTGLPRDSSQLHLRDWDGLGAGDRMLAPSSR